MLKQGISEGKSTIDRRLGGNEMIMMPSAFGKECTNVLFALKRCCILGRCVCRLKIWLRYLPQDRLVPVPSNSFFGISGHFAASISDPLTATRAPCIFDAEWLFCLKTNKPKLNRGLYTYMCTYRTRSNRTATSDDITARCILSRHMRYYTSDVGTHEILYIRRGQDTH